MAAVRERSRAELFFHVALAGVLVPVLSLPVVWGLAIACLRDRSSDRRWTRRLLGLAILDTFVAAALVISALAGMQEALQAPAPPRIGVVLEEAPSGVRVVEVLEGSPADQSGVVRGDVIARAGGHDVRTVAALMEEIARGGTIELEVERGAQRRAIVVEPEQGLAPAPVPVRCTTAREALRPSVDWSAAPYAVFLGAIAIAWIAGRRRGAAQYRIWLPLLAILVLAAMTSSAVAWLACEIDPQRMQIIGLFASEVVMAGAALAWLSSESKTLPVPADERPRWSFAKTYAGALLYAAAWMPRVVWLAIPLLFASRELGIGEVSPELAQVLGSGSADPISAVLVLTTAAVLAPIAEEALFRGVVMPHLSRTLGPWPAIYASAFLFGTLHVAHGVMFVGPMVLGAILGWARLRSRSLLVPIALHATSNGAATVLSWFA
jgi:membrane protease YdiL (CAAX protease family)